MCVILWKRSSCACEEPPNRRAGLLFVSNSNIDLIGILICKTICYIRLTMIGGVATAVLLYTPEVSPPLKLIGINPYIALVNIMASRVFRRTRAGLIQENEISTSALAEAMADSHNQFFFGGNSGGGGSRGTGIES